MPILTTCQRQTHARLQTHQMQVSGDAAHLDDVIGMISIVQAWCISFIAVLAIEK